MLAHGSPHLRSAAAGVRQPLRRQQRRRPAACRGLLAFDFVTIFCTGRGSQAVGATAGPAAAPLRLSELEERFNGNVRDSTAAFELLARRAEDVEGLPPSVLAAAARSYSWKYVDGDPTTGPWRLTLDSNSIDLASKWTLLKYLKSEPVRREMFLAFASRASGGMFDNRKVISEILMLRRQAAMRAGFPNFAEWMTRSQMLGSVAAVDELLESLSAALRPVVQAEVAVLQRFAAEQGHLGPLQPWDLDYWEERLRESRYAFDEEKLMQYLSLPRVLQSLFQLVGRLFGIEVREASWPVPAAAASRGDESSWSFDVIDMQRQPGERLGSFVLRPHTEEESTQTLVKRSELFGLKPVELISMNIPKPAAGGPCLLRLKHIETLFHEVGHVLATMFTERFEYSKVERDNMELPSYFMEAWMFHRPTFESFAVHVHTGEPLPPHVYRTMVESQSLGSARALLWSVARAALDMELHARYDPSTSAEDLQDVQRRVMQQHGVLPPHPDECWVCIFDHVFDGDQYAANEYSYLWGQVLAFDAFEAFEEAGLQDPAALASVGRRFRDTIFGADLSTPLMEVYRNFRGRGPTVDALLRHKAASALASGTSPCREPDQCEWAAAEPPRRGRGAFGVHSRAR